MEPLNQTVLRQMHNRKKWNLLSRGTSLRHRVKGYTVIGRIDEEMTVHVTVTVRCTVAETDRL